MRKGQVFWLVLSAMAMMAITACERDSGADPAAVQSGLTGGLPDKDKEEALDPPTLRARYLVAPEALRRVAIGVARGEVFEGNRPSICIELPYLDGTDGEIGRLFILSDLSCGGLDGLRAVAAREKERLPAGLEPTEALAKMNAATAQHFYTLTLTNLSFRHPVQSGYRGLPRFLLEGDEAITAVGLDAKPIAIVAGTGRHGDAVRYRLGTRTTDYSHYSNKALTPVDLAGEFDVVKAHAQWKRALKEKYRDAADARVRWQADLWKRYEDLGAMQ